MNYVWIKFLMALDNWTWRRTRAAMQRERLRWLKHELKRQGLWRN